MAIISVYRVENKFGQGMYRSSGQHLYNAPGYQDSDRRHPYASQEILNHLAVASDSSDWLFGFPSVESMRDWLFEPEWAEFLDSIGFTFCEFHIDERYVVADKNQLIFNKEHATIVQSVFVATAWEEYTPIEPVQPRSRFFDSFQNLSFGGIPVSQTIRIKPSTFLDIKNLDNYRLFFEVDKSVVEPTTKKPKPYYRVKERY